MRKFAIISILLCLFSACREAEELFSEEELARRDSLALRVAVYPTLETLPLYYAERIGMLCDSTMDIRLEHYESMTDCDTAIAGGSVHVSFTDVARILALQAEKGVTLSPVATTVSTWGLYSPKEKKINRIEQLKEKMVGMERHSRSDFWSDEILKGKDLTSLDIFRIQVGSTHLRYDMLMSGMVDAAFLSEPYASLCADSAIAACLWKQPEEATSWTVLAIPEVQQKDSLRSLQVKQLMDVYEKARRQLIARPDTALLHQIYRKVYLIPERHLKRVRWNTWKPAPLDTVNALAPQEARHWLREQRDGRFVGE